MGQIRRHFLGWDRPALPAAARWLLELPSGADLSGVLVVVPGGRAGRLLQAELVAAGRESAERADPLSPPTIVTPGELGAALFAHPTPPAGPVARRLAWMAALERAEPEVLGTLLRHPPEQGDRSAQGRLAALFEGWSREVASGGRRLGEVAEVGAAIPDFSDGARWAAAGVIQGLYEDVLGHLGRHDPDLALLDAVADRGTSSVRAAAVGPIVLIGVPELSPLMRRALERGADVSSLVFAPESERAAFDACGCVVVEHWAQAEIPITDAQIVMAEGPDSQAAAVLGEIAALDGRYSAEEILVGVPDSELGPRLVTAGRRVGAGAGLEFRPSGGRPWAQSMACGLLRAVGEYARCRSFGALAALVRHPDVEAWLAARVGGGAGVRRRAGRGETWLGVLDEWAAEGLPHSDAIEWLDAEPSKRRVLARLRAGVEAMLGPLLSGERRAAGEWGAEILGVLARVYEGRRLSRDNPIQNETIAACDVIRELGMDLARAPGVPITATEAIGLMLEAGAGCSLPAPPARRAIEMLGWLELPLDPAPAVIVTGVSEGLIPSRPSVEPMLPERLCELLGLSTARSRLARDAYLLTLLALSRPHTTLISGRRAADNEPLLPSRLLFAASDERAAARLAVYSGLEPGRRPPRVRSRARGLEGAQWPRMPIIECPLPGSLPVTAFRDYLRSPYEFYLRHVLRASAVEDPEPELSPRLFGTLIHQVLAAFAATDAAASDDPGVVRRCLADLLATRAARRVGKAPRAAIVLQLEVARQRLGLLAEHQARRVAEGWRILHAEWRPEGAAWLEVDGKPMGLRGSIDRIDRHADGSLAILDYKTGDSQQEPDRAHRAGRAGERQWVDLQLPLYRHLAAPLIGDAPVQLGYVLIGASAQGMGLRVAGWDEADLSDADKCAQDVVRAIRNREFDRADKVSEDRVVLALCGAGWAAPAPEDHEDEPSEAGP